MKKEFGGSLLIGKRKSARPFSSAQPIHTVLRSTQARGELALAKHTFALDQKLLALSAKWRIRVYGRCWNWNHVHIVVLAPTKENYQNWMRELSATITKTIEEKNRTKLTKFFDHRPYSRIVSWGRDYENIKKYLHLNELELEGRRPAKA